MAKMYDEEQLVDSIAAMIAAVERNWDAEGSGQGSRFAGETREHAQARGVVRLLLDRKKLRVVELDSL